MIYSYKKNRRSKINNNLIKEILKRRGLDVYLKEI